MLMDCTSWYSITSLLRSTLTLQDEGRGLQNNVDEALRTMPSLSANAVTHYTLGLRGRALQNRMLCIGDLV